MANCVACGEEIESHHGEVEEAESKRKFHKICYELGSLAIATAGEEAKEFLVKTAFSRRFSQDHEE